MTPAQLNLTQQLPSRCELGIIVPVPVDSRTVRQFGGDRLTELGRWSGTNLVLGDDSEQIFVAFYQLADLVLGRGAIYRARLNPVPATRHVSLFNHVLLYLHTCKRQITVYKINLLKIVAVVTFVEFTFVLWL